MFLAMVSENRCQVRKVDAMVIVAHGQCEQVYVGAIGVLVVVLVICMVIEATEQLIRICLELLRYGIDVDWYIYL